MFELYRLVIVWITAYFINNYVCSVVESSDLPFLPAWFKNCCFAILCIEILDFVILVSDLEYCHVIVSFIDFNEVDMRIYLPEKVKFTEAARPR